MDSEAFFWMIFLGSKASPYSCLPLDPAPVTRCLFIRLICWHCQMVITICNHYHRNLKTVKLFLKELSAIRFASARATTAKNYYYAKKESEIVPPAIIMHFVHLHFSVEEGDDESDGGNDSVPQPLPEAGDDSPDVGGIDGSIGARRAARQEPDQEQKNDHQSSTLHGFPPTALLGVRRIVRHR